ncbi:MAG: CooT family nickel-binding protein [Chloroflexota bacterium]|nr:CooT family nickel-binding protein [Chloroflexota bacterium]
MCQSTIYLGEKEIARDVIWLQVDGDNVQFATFFEEPQTVRGTINRLDFLKHSVTLEPIQEEDDE